jgi:putative aldouronate transport system permease protein
MSANNMNAIPVPGATPSKGRKYHGNAIRMTGGEKVFSIFNYCLLTLLGLATLFPFYIVAVDSVSPTTDFIFKSLIIWPSGFELGYYKYILGTGSQFLVSLKNTLYLTVVGSAVNMFATCLAAYVLAQKKLPFRNQDTFIMVFTMFFGGGMIPGFLLMKALNLMNKLNGLIISGLLSTYYVLFLRNFLMTIPVELQESAIIDGCSEFKLLFKIILPLSLPALAAFTLFYAVAQWNSFYGPVLYLSDQKLMPLQVYIQQILYTATVQGDRNELRKMLEDGFQPPAEALKATAIMCATLPIIVVYPFLQKYFVKGMLMGSLKG